ncbi:hypothetical protein VTO73DRAFT_12076 [Trametes versicolor]
MFSTPISSDVTRLRWQGKSVQPTHWASFAAHCFLQALELPRALAPRTQYSIELGVLGLSLQAQFAPAHTPISGQDLRLFERCVNAVLAPPCRRCQWICRSTAISAFRPTAWTFPLRTKTFVSHLQTSTQPLERLFGVTQRGRALVGASVRRGSIPRGTQSLPRTPPVIAKAPGSRSTTLVLHRPALRSDQRCYAGGLALRPQRRQDVDAIAVGTRTRARGTRSAVQVLPSPRGPHAPPRPHDVGRDGRAQAWPIARSGGGRGIAGVEYIRDAYWQATSSMQQAGRDIAL